MQFDVIIGNPPYQGGDLGHAAYKSIWPLFWKKCVELAKDDGFVYLVTPTTWCSPTSDLSRKDALDKETRLWNIFDKYTSKANVTDIKAYFPGVGASFGIVSVDKSGSDGLSFSNGEKTSLGFFSFSGTDEVEDNLSSTNNIQSRYRISAHTDGRYRVSIFKSRKVCPENVEVLAYEESPSSGANQSLFVNITVPTLEEAIMVRSRVLECSEILNKHCRYNGFIDQKILGMISL